MTQRDHVLHMLQDAGDRGITTGEFLDARISRFSARIDELRRDGYMIVKHRVTASRYRYELIGADETVRPAHAADGTPKTPTATGASTPSDGTQAETLQHVHSRVAGRAAPGEQTLFAMDPESVDGLPAMYQEAA